MSGDGHNIRSCKKFHESDRILGVVQNIFAVYGLSCTVNGSDLDSVTLKATKLRTVDGIWGLKTGNEMPNIFFLLPVRRLAIGEVTKEK